MTVRAVVHVMSLALMVALAALGGAASAEPTDSVSGALTTRAERFGLAMFRTTTSMQLGGAPSQCDESTQVSSPLLLLAQSGCCSSHNGVCGCSSAGKTQCCDGTQSPTCTCSPPPPAHTLTITAGPTGTPNPAASEGTVSLTVTAADSLPHTLSYSWSASCQALPSNGAFSIFTSRTPTWTAPPNTTGNQRSCAIQVSISDGQGLSRLGSFTQAVNSAIAPPPPPPPNGQVNVNISGSQFEIRSPDTVRIRNADVAGYPGKYWADIQWSPTHLAFLPIAAAQETSPAFYEKTELLKGKWHFVYTIISAFTDDYTFNSIPGTTNSQGGYLINGTDQFGGPVVASYWPTDQHWTMLDPSSILDKYHVFYTDGASILPNSCYRQILHSDNSTSNCYPLVGTKTGSADLFTVAQPDSALTGDHARERDASMTEADAARPSALDMEKYWIMKGVMGLSR